VFVEKRALSSMRNSPRSTIGLPKTKNKGYYPENKNDYMGSSSPAPNRYNPNSQSVKILEPSMSVGKSQRFHKPSSVFNLNS